MSWRYLGQSNAKLVEFLRRGGVVRKDEVQEAMTAVDRALFVPFGKICPYADAPQLLGYNATISAPHMHAHCLHYLLDSLKPGSHVLDVGSGSGYFTALVAYTLRNYHTSTVIGLEHVEELVQISIKNCKKIPFLQTMMSTDNLKILHADGFKGCKRFAPYDCIHVGAAVEEVPESLLDQLNVGGKMVIPLGPDGGRQMLTVVSKLKNGDILMDPKLQVMYVPLTTLTNQLR